jgi:sugar phosphate isomerase/epimerase
MLLAISNIAWEPEEDAAAGAALLAAGVSALEIAPTKIWRAPLEATEREVRAYGAALAGRGFTPVALQALLFGHPELTIFENAHTRAHTEEYLAGMLQLAAWLGARVLVFGSPKNRRRNGLPLEEAVAIACGFFRRLGDRAAALGVQLAIEPNPAEYGCDFIRTLSEGAELVRLVGSPGFRLHADASAMILNGEEASAALAGSFDCLAHFHISDPFLGVPGPHAREHRSFARELRALGYPGYASIEMRSGVRASNLEAIQAALEFARQIYSD